MELNRTQIRTLKNLYIFFKKNDNRVLQAESSILKNSGNCGCFGALLAEYFNLTFTFGKQEKHGFITGSFAFSDKLGIEKRKLDKLLTKHGAGKYPYGGDNWKKRPYEVLHSILKEEGKHERR